MCQRAAVDVFEFAANGYSMCDAGHLETPSQRKLAEIVRRGLAFHGWIGGQNHFANFAQPQQQLEFLESQFSGSDSVEGRQVSHENEIAAAKPSRLFDGDDVGWRLD